MADIVLGRYAPYPSFLHRMDPRAKVMLLVLLTVAIFLPFPSWAMTFTMDGLIFLFAASLLGVAHLGFRQFWSSIRSLWFTVVFLLVIYVLVPPANPTWPAFSLGGFTVYWDSILESARIFLRLVLMIMVSLILTATTKPLDLTSALEWYLAPLKLVGFPSHIVAMTVTLALRFIPTILEDVGRIMKAQSSRGVDFERGPLRSRFRALVSLIVPLFVSAFSRSGDLASAMECRGYDPTQKRTRYRQLRFHWADYLNVLLTAAFLGAFIYVSVTHFDLYGALGLSVK